MSREGAGQGQLHVCGGLKCSQPLQKKSCEGGIKKLLQNRRGMEIKRSVLKKGHKSETKKALFNLGLRPQSWLLVSTHFSPIFPYWRPSLNSSLPSPPRLGTV